MIVSLSPSYFYHISPLLRILCSLLTIYLLITKALSLPNLWNIVPEIKHMVLMRWDAFKKAERLKPFGQGTGTFKLRF